MTLLPIESRDVRGFDGEALPLNDYCAAPGCFGYATDAHHLWRRSELGGAYNWVVIEANTLDVEAPLEAWHYNIVGLCRDHHHAVTVNEAWIKLENGKFRWYGLDPTTESWGVYDWKLLGSLDPQPGQQEKAEPIPGKPCRACGRKVPEPFKGEKKRNRATYTIRVPKDAAEDGLEVLKSLVEQAADKLGTPEKPPYFTLVASLWHFVTTNEFEESAA